MMKRVISLLLILVMLTGMIPVFAQAQEEPTTAVDNGEITVQGTNGFGSLLAEDIAQAQETMEEQENAGYTLTDLEITGNTATVTYDSLEEATVVVAIYTEDGMQMVTSGQATVIPEETTATVTIDGEMPQYFMASAYLLDSYDMSPLCPVYDTSLYTKEMQDLLASTVEDYDPERVLQLDDSTETNFAVYAETTKVIEQVEGVNTVSSVDEETNTYIIENADESITSLKEGDVFAYPYGETEILIIKVASITVDGTTVTITGGELEIDEVFEVAKLEGYMGTEDVEVDMSSADDGAEYLGKSTDESQVRSRTTYGLNNGSISRGTSAKFEYTKYEAGVFSFKGSVKIYTKVSLEYYITKSFQDVSLKIDFGVELEIDAEFELVEKEGKNLEGKLGTLKFPVLPAVTVEFAPSLVAELSVTIAFKLNFETTLGFGFENNKNRTGFYPIYTTPKVTTDLEIEGELFIGLKLTPKVKVAEGLIAEAQLSGQIGFEIKGSTTIVSSEYWSDERHDCIGCVEGSISAKFKVTPSIQFLKSKKLKFSTELVNATWKLTDFYVCAQHMKSGLSKCPDVSYKTTIQVQDVNGTAVSDVNILSGTTDLGTTNKKGILVTYLPEGNYQLTAVINGKNVAKSISVSQAGTVKIIEPASSNTGSSGTTTGSTTGKPNILDGIQAGTSDFQGFVDGGAVTASGVCGDNVNWTLYDSGTLVISGSGAMDDYVDGIVLDSPWRDQWGDPVYGIIENLIIHHGVTSIGAGALWNCDNLTSVTIPNSVTSIGDSAFWQCTNLTSIDLPSNVTSIGNIAFGGCDNLNGIWVSENNSFFSSDSYGVLFDKKITILLQAPGVIKGHYTIPSSVVGVGNYAFYSCDNLSSVTIPSSVTSIGEYAFCFCTSLKDVYYTGTQAQWSTVSIDYANEPLTNATIHCSDGTIGGNVTASGVCGDNLTWTLYDSGTLHIYGSGAMWDYRYADGSSDSPWAKYNIYNIVIHDGVTTIGDSAYECCYNLTSMTIPNSVTSIGDYAFSGCASLANVTIPDGVTTIGDSAFFWSGLTSVTIPDSVTTIENWAFGWTPLASVTIPDSVTTIGENVFNSCHRLTNVTIPDSVTTIEWCAFSNCTGLTSVTIGNRVTTIGDSAFDDCTSLTSVTIPDSVTTIEADAFRNCDSLTSITIPANVTTIEYAVFADCDSLTNITVSNKNSFYSSDSRGVLFDKAKFKLLQVPAGIGSSTYTIPDSVLSVGDYAFCGCDSLTSVTIPDSVSSIGAAAFEDCANLTRVMIPVSVTSIGNSAFRYCTNLTDVYYTGTQAQWQRISIGSYGNTELTSATIHYNSTVSATMVTSNEMTVANGSLSGLIGGEMTSANAAFGGEYGTAVENNVTVKTADFSNLVPGKDYVLLSLASIDADDPLSADNLLFIDQGVADENCCLSFRYLQRVNTDLSYVMVCGASNKDLNDAQITFPRMTADGETQIVQPVVVYEDKTLIEGQDYVITGDVDFTEAGEYTCYIRGIYNYTGLVTCTYQVSDVTIPTLTLKAPALEFKDMICVVAFYTAENIDDVVEMGMVTYTEKVDVVDINTAAHVIPGASYDEGSGRYFSNSQGIHAKYLGDTVYLACYAKLSDGTYVYTKLAPYSPITYATNQLKNSTNTQLKQLVAAMLNYGSEAQLYFGHNVDALANAGMTAEQLALPEAYRADMVGSVPAASATKQGVFANNKGFTVRKPAISFEGAFSINYFFTPAYAPVDGITLYYWTESDFNDADVLTVENASGSIAMDGEGIGQYRGDITGISAKDLSKAVYVAAVYSDGTTTWTSGVLGYSIGAYCSNQSNTGSTIAALAEATAVYGYHAKQYFG